MYKYDPNTHSFNWNCGHFPPEAEIEYDERLNVDASAADSGMLVLSTLSDRVLGIVARLPDGAVLDASAVTPVHADNGGYWRVVSVYPDGTRVVEGALRLGAVPEGLTVVLKVFVSGVTFEDGTLTRVLTADDFDEDGVCRYRFVQSADSKSSVCHSTAFYQDGTLIGHN